MPAPWFFDRLGIAPTRDAKQIKRAYALALKAIDQQDEREAFETLRSAYETALAWAREQGPDELRLDSETVLPPGGQLGAQVDPQVGPQLGAPVGAQAGSQADFRSEPQTDAHIDPEADSQVDPKVDPTGASPATSQTVLQTATSADRASTPPHLDGDPAASIPGPAPSPAPAPARAASTLISNESYGASRVAIRQWINRLFKPQQTPLADIFDQALNDPRLTHLDSRTQLEAQLIEALYRDRPGHADLFMLAAERFGWAERNARPAGSARESDWVYRVVNHQLSWTLQPADVLATQQAAIDAAIASATPTRQQAFNHHDALQAFNEGFSAWAELVLPAGRVGIWRQAYEKLSEGWLRAARVRQQFPRNFSRIAATLALLIVVGSLVYGMLKPTRVAAPSEPPSLAAEVQAAMAKPPPPGSGPVLAYEFLGAVTKDSCETAHEFVHESNWLQVNDADAVALLSTRAFLCQDHKLWPQAKDPLMDCLRAERGSAFTAGRPESPAACAAKQTAGR